MFAFNSTLSYEESQTLWGNVRKANNNETEMRREMLWRLETTPHGIGGCFPDVF